MDDLDIELIRCLNENARKSLREMARELNVSLTTVSNRVKKMEEEGIINGYIPVVDQEKLGYDLLAVITLRISHGKLMDVQNKLADNPRVCEIFDVTGDWDSIVIARFRNREELNDFVKVLVAMDHVERTNTHMALNVVKQEKRAFV